MDHFRSCDRIEVGLHRSKCTSLFSRPSKTIPAISPRQRQEGSLCYTQYHSMEDQGENGVAFQDCDDDGETAAGGRVLHLMQLMDLWNVMVVVTRWYGGHQLGPKRFSIINTVARDAFVKAGLVKDDTSTKKKGNR